ncbi:hypothetical protein B0H14DRAFT_3512359 [Mycena olivaceomarginata]|nr:hypothetical protein B0H14DRAFT_3512359 [Mycena olivaceomarginata]
MEFPPKIVLLDEEISAIGEGRRREEAWDPLSSWLALPSSVPGWVLPVPADAREASEEKGTGTSGGRSGMEESTSRVAAYKEGLRRRRGAPGRGGRRHTAQEERRALSLQSCERGVRAAVDEAYVEASAGAHGCRRVAHRKERRVRGWVMMHMPAGSSATDLLPRLSRRGGDDDEVDADAQTRAERARCPVPMHARRGVEYDGVCGLPESESESGSCFWWGSRCWQVKAPLPPRLTGAGAGAGKGKGTGTGVWADGVGGRREVRVVGRARKHDSDDNAPRLLSPRSARPCSRLHTTLPASRTGSIPNGDKSIRGQFPRSPSCFSLPSSLEPRKGSTPPSIEALQIGWACAGGAMKADWSSKYRAGCFQQERAEGG